MSRYDPSIQLRRQIRGVQMEMMNIAERVSRKGQKVMEHSAAKVMMLAQKYSPYDTGALQDPSNWEIEKQSNGSSGRHSFIVRVKGRRVARTLKNGRKIYLSQYARIMHDGLYKRLGKRSREKALKYGWHTNPRGSGAHVGTLYLTRAGNHMRPATLQAVRNALQKELRNHGYSNASG